jgi:flagellar basal-body rod modification protein FlgD
MTGLTSVAQTAPISSASGTGGKQIADLKDEDFFKLLITQLQTQDPMKPMDNDKLLEQVQSLQTLSTNRDLSTAIKTLTDGQSLSSASSLIGKTIRGMIGETKIEGTVTKVSLSDGKVTLHVGDKRISLADVDEILGSSDAASTTTAASTPSATATSAATTASTAPLVTAPAQDSNDLPGQVGEPTHPS